MLVRPLEDAARLVEVVAGIEQQHDPQPVPAPLLNLVEVAALGIERIRRFLRRTNCSRSSRVAATFADLRHSS
jgi:hypothetical protein